MPSEGAHPKRIGKYDILAVLGRGGMGVVYEARDPVLDRIVAVKTISTSHDDIDEERLERLKMEARSAARLHHPNIVTVFDFGNDGDVSYIVMEHVTGSDLAHLLAKNTPMSLLQRLDIIVQICNGLAYAHDCGVTHRDMKPSNVRITANHVAKILDFGLARVDNKAMTRTGYMSGTLGYISPERLNGQTGKSDDIFALGAVAYEILTCQRAFPGSEAPEVIFKILSQPPPPPSTVANVPAAFDPLIAKAIARDLNQRYASAADFAAALQAVVETLDEATLMAGAEPSQTTAASAPVERRLGTDPRRSWAVGTAPPTTQSPAATAAGTQILPAPDSVSGEVATLLNTPSAALKTNTSVTTPGDSPTVVLSSDHAPTRISPRGNRQTMWIAAAVAAVVLVGAVVMLNRHQTPLVASPPPPTTSTVAQSTGTIQISTTPASASSGTAALRDRAMGNLNEVSRRFGQAREAARLAGITISQSRQQALEERLQTLRGKAESGDDETVRSEGENVLHDYEQAIEEARNAAQRAVTRSPGKQSGKPPLIAAATPLRARPTAVATTTVQATPVTAPPPTLATLAPPTVTQQPPPVAAPPPRAAAADPKAEITAFIKRVATAYESHDVDFFRQHYARFNDQVRKAISSSPSTRVSLVIESIEMTDANHARVTLQRTDSFGSDAPPATQSLIYELSREPDGWSIVRFGRA
jgi:serine/threonine protein kinase